MVHACRGRVRTWSPSCLPLPVLHRAWRLRNEHQHNGRAQYHDPHWDQRVNIHPHNFCACDISAVTIPELILGSCLVYHPEIETVWPEIQRSGWRIEVCQHKYDTRTDVTCDGRD